MSRKKSSSKLSAVKRGNRLRTKLQKQGKLKTKRNRNKPKKITKRSPIEYRPNSEDEASENDENVLDMIEKEDISFLRNAVASKSYSFLNDINNIGEKRTVRGKHKAKDNNNEPLESVESQYEKILQRSAKTKKKKFLLPIKTSKGLVIRSEEVISSEDEESLPISNTTLGSKKDFLPDLTEKFSGIEEIRTADLLAFRQNTLAKKKMKIGLLCSGLTENPEQKIHNFKPLIQMLNDNEVESCITAKKLALVSLQEVFKDLLPEYQIKHHNDPNVKLKKAVKQLQTFESDLLKYYKMYLKEIEKIVSLIKRKRGDNRDIKKVHISLAEQALKCLCDLLCAHPYFNFSKNVIHLLVPFLNSGRASIREIVSIAFKMIFKSDRKGDISLEIVRNINKFVKSKRNVVHIEFLQVLLSLNLKNVDLDKEKEKELMEKKEEARKHKLIRMSKREKKRIKKFQSLQKDLLETKAEENRKSKEHCMTEITKTIFTIYFRILKDPSSSKMLNAALEGLAKFAHCINVEFYQDLIVVLDKIVQNENLGYKEKLFCVWTVFTVLHYQGATIYIDPVKFYSHFYSNILQINAGSNHSDLPIILKTVNFVLLKRRKYLSLQRLLAFTKRLTALALQVLPNGSLALLSQIRDILQVNNSTDMLLDFESVQGQGIYYPEMEEPEYCNAGATSLWELLLLQKHYHPTVREFACRLAKLEGGTEDTPQDKFFIKESPEQLFELYNGDNVKFNPAIPPPRKFPKTKKKGTYLINEELSFSIKNILKSESFGFNDN